MVFFFCLILDFLLCFFHYFLYKMAKLFLLPSETFVSNTIYAKLSQDIALYSFLLYYYETLPQFPSTIQSNQNDAYYRYVTLSCLP